MLSQIELLGGRIRVGAVELLSRSRATTEDVVVLSGTLLEGIGNLYSDLDLYVIGNELPAVRDDIPATLVVREDGRIRRVNEILEGTVNIVLDVQYYTFRELATLARSLNELYSESRQSTRMFRKTLHPDDEDLIHKLLTGMVLQDGTSCFNACETFDSGKFCFLKYRNEVGGYAEFRDLIGSWTDGDLDSCLYNIRSYLISQICGVMFLAGSTNPRPKWFLRRLTSLGEEYCEFRSRIITWMHTARHTELQKREAIETACDLMDTSYAIARTLLSTNPRYFVADEALALTDREFGERSRSDPEIAEEFQLLQRMFNSTGSPLFTQLDVKPRRWTGVAA